MNNKFLKTGLCILFSLSFTVPAWSLTADERITAFEQTVLALQNTLNTVKANSVLKLNGNLDANALGDVLFRGVNVQIVNGNGSTLSANGKGMLIMSKAILVASAAAIKILPKVC